MRIFYGLFLVSALALLVVSVFSALAAANTVEPSGVGESAAGIGANDLKPPECAALNLTRIVTGSGNINGNASPELILGSPANDRIRGNGGSDCILGGGGNDDLRGGAGNDVCIGGPGNDRFASCQTAIQ